MSRLAGPFVVLAALAACASPTPIPPAETPYLLAKTAEARALSPAPVAQAAPTSPTAPNVASPAARAETLDPTAGIVDVADLRVAEFVEALRAPARAGAAIAARPLGEDDVLAAVWARNPAVAAARDDVDAMRRVYEQAGWLEDVETRFRSLSVPSTNVRDAMGGMAGDPLAYPGAAALRGEMLDQEVAMAAARLRMRLLEESAAAIEAYHDILRAGAEEAIRREQASVLERLVSVSRARVEIGRAPQAELLEAQAELAMAQNDVADSVADGRAARRRLLARLDLAPDTALTPAMHMDDEVGEPNVSALTALAARWSPEIAMARAEARRLAVAERMAARMANAPRRPALPPTGDAMGAMGSGDAAVPGGPGATRDVAAAPPSWAAEISARRAAAERAVDAAARAADRMVSDMARDLDAMSRMARVARDATEPSTREALAERVRLYEAGRGEFTDVLAAVRRHLEAQRAVITARHATGVMRARLWMAVGVRPDRVPGETR